jgi:hypothetical protein
MRAVVNLSVSRRTVPIAALAGPQRLNPCAEPFLFAMEAAHVRNYFTKTPYAYGSK